MQTNGISISYHFWKNPLNTCKSPSESDDLIVSTVSGKYLWYHRSCETFDFS